MLLLHLVSEICCLLALPFVCLPAAACLLTSLYKGFVHTFVPHVAVQHETLVRMILFDSHGVQVKAVSVEEDENGGADSDEKTNANWILQNI